MLTDVGNSGCKLTSEEGVVFPPKLSNRDVKPWVVFVNCTMMMFQATWALEAAAAHSALDHGHGSSESTGTPGSLSKWWEIEGEVSPSHVSRDNDCGHGQGHAATSRRSHGEITASQSLCAATSTLPLPRASVAHGVRPSSTPHARTLRFSGPLAFDKNP